MQAIVNSVYLKRWSKVKAKVLEVTVYESLKEGKENQSIFLQFLQYAFSLQELYGHHMKHSMLHIHRICV